MKKLLPILLLGTALFADEVVIKNINFQNLNQLSQTTAQELIDLKVGDKLNIKNVNSSIKRLFEQGYFEDIKVEEIDGSITILFVEKKVVASISIDGYKENLEDKDLYQFLGLKKGEIYTEKKIEQVKQRIKEALIADGKLDSQVEVKTEQFNERSVALKFMVNEGEEIIIRELKLKGANNLDESDFDNYIANKAREFMGWMFGRNDGKVKLQELPLDSQRIKSVYMKEGYIDADVSDGIMEVDFSKYDAVLTYNIKEGTQYTLTKVNYIIDNPLITEDMLNQDLKLRIGKTYNGKKMSDDLETIRNRVRDQGYAFAEVFPNFKRVSANEVEVTYTISTKEKVYINDVIISGNVRTIDRVIRRDVFVGPGELYNYSELEESRKALKRTGFFDEVEIVEKKRDDLGNKVDIIVKIQEARTGSITVGGGYGTADGFSVIMSLSDKNVFGSGIELKSQIDTSSTDKQFDVSMFNPRVSDSEYSLGANAFMRNYESSTYESSTNGAGISLGRQLTRYVTVSNKVLATVVDINDRYISDDIDETVEYTKVSMIPSVSFNNTDNYMLPREGVLASTSLEYGGLAGDLDFWKSYSKFSYFYGLEDLIDFDLIARYKAKLGYIVESQKVPSTERFTLGGMSTIRGYKSGSLYTKTDMINGNYTTTGGLNTFINSVELSLPLTKSDKLRFTWFYDYGMIGNDSFEEIQRSSTGFSFDWISPIGPIQLIFPRALDKKDGDKTTQFEFSLGKFF